MIQRIQTVYLLIAEILIGILFFVPLAGISGQNASIYRFDIKGLSLDGILKSDIASGSMPLILVWAASMMLIVVCIFMYKNRKQQIRFSIITIFILLGFGSLIFYSVLSTATILSGGHSFRIFIVFPVIAAILIYMAIRAISKDERLVRSIDRIR
ncbi:MAG: DUF4293 domain-containing protein [Mariniphaga sp.]